MLELAEAIVNPTQGLRVVGEQAKCRRPEHEPQRTLDEAAIDEYGPIDWNTIVAEE